MALQAVSTAGMKVLYAQGGSTIPTSSWAELTGVKALPALGDTVNTLQTTPLSATKNHTYILGLADSGGAIQLTVNDAPAFRTSFASMLSKYKAAVSASSTFWIQYAYPSEYGMSSFYYPADLVDLGFGGAEVDAVLENFVNLTPTADYKFDSAHLS